MSAAQLLSWREGVSAVVAEDGGLRIEGPGPHVVLRPAPSVADAIRRLAPPGVDENLVADRVLADGGNHALAGWYFTLQKLADRGLVCRSVHAAGHRLATLVPVSPSFAMTAAVRPLMGRYLLSRFAYLRREGNVMVLESPLAHARVVLDDPATAALIAALAAESTVADLTARLDHLPSAAVPLLLGLLDIGGMIDEVRPTREPPSALDAWEFHDLLFHARVRRGNVEAPSGATYRLAGLMAPPPAVKPPPAGERYRLFRPDLDTLQREDPPLSRVVERRRSIRVYADQPIAARQLGEFLYRVARVQDERDVEIQAPRGPLNIAMASRPYPSGGALYELEFYAAIAACDGLEPGLYYYEPRDHGLIRIRDRSAEVEWLLRDAASSAAIPRETVQVLLIVSARLPRLAWKYASIAYSLVLKHVGVVYQSMYLAATAMNLAPCALGRGDPDVFARAAGLDDHAETSVGEFLLGSRRRDEASG